MALIKCPECGNEVSDQAYMCPRCGFPITSQKTITKAKRASNVADGLFCPKPSG